MTRLKHGEWELVAQIEDVTYGVYKSNDKTYCYYGGVIKTGQPTTEGRWFQVKEHAICYAWDASQEYAEYFKQINQG